MSIVISLPMLEFSNGSTEDVRVAWQMIYEGVAGFFDDASYRLVLAPVRSIDGIAFSSEDDAANRIIVTTEPDEEVDGRTIVNITLQAPWRTVYGRSGAYSGNLQIKNSSGIEDLAIVKGTIVKRPTLSELAI